MKIALIPQPGHIHENSNGYNKRIYHLAKLLAARGHAVRLFVSDSRSQVPGVEVVTLPYPAHGMELRLQFISRAIQASQDCDVINAQTDHLATIFDTFSRVPIVHTIITSGHMPNAKLLFDTYADLTYSAVSRSVRETFSSLPNVSVIHNGCDTERFALGEGFGDYVLSLSRIDEQKGVRHAVQAALSSGTKLVIAGKILDQAYFDAHVAPYLGSLVSYVGELGISQYGEKIALLQNARATLVLSEYDEGFSNTVLESLSCGTPVIASALPSYREIVVDGETGFIAASIDDLPALLSRVGEINRVGCREAVTKAYTYDHMVDGYEKLFTQIWKNKKQ